jgi:carboxymethylenebutenolidase
MDRHPLRINLFLVMISIVSLLMVVSISNYFQDAEAIAYFPPPLKQIKSGVSPSDVTCTEGLELVLKQSNGQPSCLKPSSVAKLIERGWAIHILPDYTLDNNNSEIFPLGDYDIEIRTVSYFEQTKGYLAKPSVQGEFPAIIMIHEWWGLNDNIKEMAEKLASHGYIVLAVDLYNNKVGTTSEEARQLINSFDSESGINNMNSAISYLKTEYSTENIGSIGWCFGGGQSLNLSMNNSDLDATVMYYGQVSTDSQKLSNISWPLLGIFAEMDKGIPVDSVKKFQTQLDDLKITNEIIIYPGVDHAFANPSGERYAPEESKDAWQKTIKFFNENLK